MLRLKASFATLFATFALLVGAGPANSQVVPVPGQQTAGVPITEIRVRGNQRVDEATIRVVSTLEAGRNVSRFDLQNAIRRLMATGNFQNVEIYSEGEPATGVVLTIEVEERPLIAEYEIVGLQRVRPSAIRDTVGLQPNQPYNPQLVVTTERMIRDMLAQEGVQLAGLDTTWIPTDDPNTFRLLFDVTEGNRLAIAEIQFEGNEAFTDEDLRGAMRTKPEGFFWFRSGRFDRTAFEEDLQQNLPNFYGSRGFIDFAVVSDTLVVDPVTGKARLTIAVQEGPQYRLGEFRVEGARRFPTEQLERMFLAQTRTVLGLPFGGGEREAGEVFNQSALQSAEQRVAQLYRNEGYLFAQANSAIERVEGEDGQPRVNVTLVVQEGRPFYVNRVTIQGNTYTHESVIRDRLVVYPGDLYSEDRLLQSYRSIAALGFFETPLATPGIHPDPETGEVDITFTVTERQTGSINFGTSIGGGGYGYGGGLTGFIGYSQPNLFGQAKQASLQAEYGYNRSSFSASYTDPQLFGTRRSASISVFHTDDRYRGFSFTDGQYVRTGASVRYGFPVGNFRWTRAFAGYSISRYKYEARNVDDCAPGDIFCQPSALGSSLSLAVTRDTKDHPLFPSSGTRQSVSLQQTGGPLGGDGNFQKLTLESEWWTPVATLGGTELGSRPFILTFGLGTRGGAVFGDAQRFPLERFFLGGTQFGQMLRGYEESTLTPFGYFDRADERVSDSNRLGDAFLVTTGELAMRFNDNISLSLFGDAGGIWSDPAQIDPTQLFRSLGVGITIVTPFGPLGLDFAYGFDRTDVNGNPDPGWKFHFKMNQPGF